jgi:hypothetical protein
MSLKAVNDASRPQIEDSLETKKDFCECDDLIDSS